MGVYNFKSLSSHVGHKIEVVYYGFPPVNVAIECHTCGEVLVDYDKNEASDDPIGIYGI